MVDEFFVDGIFEKCEKCYINLKMSTLNLRSKIPSTKKTIYTISSIGRDAPKSRQENSYP
jgi:hypothetical protein